MNTNQNNSNNTNKTNNFANNYNTNFYANTDNTSNSSGSFGTNYQTNANDAYNYNHNSNTNDNSYNIYNQSMYTNSSVNNSQDAYTSNARESSDANYQTHANDAYNSDYGSNANGNSYNIYNQSTYTDSSINDNQNTNTNNNDTENSVTSSLEKYEDTSYTNEDTKTKQKGINIKIAIAVCLICCILSSVASSIITFSLMDSNGKKETSSDNQSSDSDTNSPNINNENTTSDTDGNTAQESSTAVSINNSSSSPAANVAKKVSPSIVGIRVTTKEDYGFYGEYETSSEGSGVIYTNDGYIITNYHVISEMLTYSGDKNQKSTLSVFLNQDTNNEYTAEVIGYDQASDLAVIKIEGTDLKPIETGNSDNLIVGDIAIAIGNPGGLDFMGSITQGIISGLDRNIQTEDSFEDLTLIQTDAAINPGNSGGALCNSEGKLIGINSVKLVETGYESMGFAIPVNDVIRICDEIIENGSGENVYLGLEFNDVDYTPEILESRGFPAGLVIVEVSYGSPAHKAGFETYDILVSFNNQSIESLDDLVKAKNECSAGDTVTAKVYREISSNSFFFSNPSYEYVDLEITFD